ncbi:MAG: hypothetical protein ACJ73J_04060 [Actinomycetes bacterium]
MTDDKPIVTMSGSSGPPDLDDVLHEDAVRSTLPILGGCRRSPSLAWP